MSEVSKVRWRWLRGMYIYTTALAGVLGAAILLAPARVASVLGLPSQDPIVYGVVGSFYLAFGVLSLFGLRAPLRFVPVLLLQLVYKCAWLAGVAFPLLIRGQFPRYGLSFVAVFATYIIGDLIALPFSRAFGIVRTEQRSIEGA
jgi:hypothetical protein